MLELLHKTQLLTTMGLVVLIWMVQILIYPFFAFIDEKDFKESMIFHQRQITAIVMPLMLFEIIAAALLVFVDFNIIHVISLTMVILIWLSTFFIQVPLHHELSASGKDSSLIQKLVRTNWMRTILWSLKLILVLTYSA